MPNETQLFGFIFRVHSFQLPSLEKINQSQVVMRIDIPPFSLTRHKVFDKFLVAISPLLGKMSPVLVSQL